MSGFGNAHDPASTRYDRIMRISEGASRLANEQQAALRESQDSLKLLGVIAEASTAKEFYDRLNTQIKAFDESLDQDHEVGVRLVSFGQSVTFHVTHLGYHNPSLIFFYGESENGNRLQLIQHISQISFVLIAMDKPQPDEPKRPFGFAQTPNQSTQVNFRPV
ncbi:MAG: DUF6173 family protein [Isosphaeraceae bacterium]|nr:DUF6173 family protein [Isosphaeraceae bacterium]